MTEIQDPNKPSPSLRTSKSFFALQSSKSSRASPKRSKRVNIFKRAGLELNHFLVRLRSFGEEVFSSDQVVSKLFVESDSESFMDYLERSSKGISVSEEIFLSEYKKYKNLDLMYEQNQLKTTTEDIKSSNTNNNSDHTRYSLRDLMTQKNSSTSSPVIQDEVLNVEDDDSLDEDASNEFDGAIGYQDLDMSKMRAQMIDENTDESTVGEALWEYRREKWLTAGKSRDNDDTRKTSSSFFNQIPKESYVRIYNSLVDKGKTLKDDRHINLENLMKVINAGWIAQDKWERAAKGLP